MVQWRHKDRTLLAKLVYYGPAFGGKTTNLAALHRITDPDNRQKLLAIQTSDDRTLFFDLLPFDLGDILGYQVALKLYTVPGQVRYEATRQIVLSGADAVVFVADSSPGREEQNRWSLQNLRMNMRAKGLDAERVPVLFQYNKQDLPEAAPPDEVARWLRVPAGQGFAAVATEGEGVVETFLAATRAMLHRIVEGADERTRRALDPAELERHLDRAFAPVVARAGAGLTDPVVASPDPIVLQDDDLLQSSVQAGLDLGERLCGEASRAARLEREADAYRALSEALRKIGASFDGHAIIDAVLEFAGKVLEAPVVSLIRPAIPGSCSLGRIRGASTDPLLSSAAGRAFLDRVLDSGGSCVAEDLAQEIGDTASRPALQGLRAAAVAPVACDPPAALVVYASEPDGRFTPADVRFMNTIASHLAVGLEKTALHRELERRREELEAIVDSRTRRLREAYDELRGLEQTKDRFLSGLSHEMKSPLTAMISAAVFMRDYRTNAGQRNEMTGTIVEAGETLQGLMDSLFRFVAVEGDDGTPPAVEVVAPQRLVEEVTGIAVGARLDVDLSEAPESLAIDVGRVARALANLVDNAVKFSPDDRPVELTIRAVPGDDAGAGGGRVVFSVLDRGRGVPDEDRERIFLPFEQGGETLRGKPRGVGLGLYEVRRLTHHLGGTVGLRRRNGGGSEFRIELPAAVAAAAGEEARRA